MCRFVTLIKTTNNVYFYLNYRNVQIKIDSLCKT